MQLCRSLTNVFINTLVDTMNSNDVDILMSQYCCADAVALIIDDPQYCCIAWLDPSRHKMFSISAWNCATRYYLFSHVIGHNFVSLTSVG